MTTFSTDFATYFDAERAQASCRYDPGDPQDTTKTWCHVLGCGLQTPSTRCQLLVVADAMVSDAATPPRSNLRGLRPREPGFAQPTLGCAERATIRRFGCSWCPPARLRWLRAGCGLDGDCARSQYRSTRQPKLLQQLLGGAHARAQRPHGCLCFGAGQRGKVPRARCPGHGGRCRVELIATGSPCPGMVCVFTRNYIFWNGAAISANGAPRPGF